MQVMSNFIQILCLRYTLFKHFFLKNTSFNRLASKINCHQSGVALPFRHKEMFMSCCGWRRAARLRYARQRRIFFLLESPISSLRPDSELHITPAGPQAPEALEALLHPVDIGFDEEGAGDARTPR